MKKVVRLTESDLIKIVKRVIQEDAGFTFGDKVKNTIKGAVGLRQFTDDEERLADDIMTSVENGDFEVVRTHHAMAGPQYVLSYTIRLNLNGGTYIVHPYESMHYGYITDVTPPRGPQIRLEQSGFTKKLMKLIKNSDRGDRFRYPR